MIRITATTSRRNVLCAMASAAIAAPCALLAASTAPASRPQGQVMTVDGPVHASQLGVTLPHEHLLVDFIGADRATPDRYDRDDVQRAVLPHLKQLAALGCSTLVDCTPAYLGRDPILLKRLSQASGLKIITNTGYYGAGPDFKYLPQHARDESVDQLAQRWVREFEHGIDGTGVRPSFIKIGVNESPLHELHRKLVLAAAQTHHRTGLTIASHSGDGNAALEQLAILREQGVAPRAFIWVHAQVERDPELHARIAEMGAWLSFDGIAPETVQRHVELVLAARRRGKLGQVLVSHDAGWYRPGEAGGGHFRPFDTLFVLFLPALRHAGLTEAEIAQLTTHNPAAALTLGPTR
ncbi:phosphotriesterase family protein [Fontivita pretiosa]|uniref:phosphotriesterase family protein n=1 Tax=Fontivita pretiosa TaxID=2989684 RepID=UPI003D16890F